MITLAALRSCSSRFGFCFFVLSLNLIFAGICLQFWWLFCAGIRVSKTKDLWSHGLVCLVQVCLIGYLRDEFQGSVGRWRLKLLWGCTSSQKKWWRCLLINKKLTSSTTYLRRSSNLSFNHNYQILSSFCNFTNSADSSSTQRLATKVKTFLNKERVYNTACMHACTCVYIQTHRPNP